MDISGVENIITMITNGVITTFLTWSSMEINGISYLTIVVSFLLASIIFTIVFAYIKSRLSNPYVLEKRKKND